MPYIEVRTSKTIEKIKQIQMKDFLGKNISIIPEKEECKLMVEFVTDANIFYGGSNKVPSVKVSVIFSEEQEKRYLDTFAKALCNYLSEGWQIEMQRIIVLYDVNAWYAGREYMEELQWTDLK